MPDETSARLWDLRAQCEVILRGLTSAQKCLEHYKEGDSNGLSELRNELARLTKAADLLRQSLNETDEHAAELPETYQRPGKTGAA
jgi:hypothetical protein